LHFTFFKRLVKHLIVITLCFLLILVSVNFFIEALISAQVFAGKDPQKYFLTLGFISFLITMFDFFKACFKASFKLSVLKPPYTKN